MVKVFKKSSGRRDSTDLNLLVTSTGGGQISDWSRDRIVDALKEEAGLPEDEAKKVAKEVEDRVFGAKIDNISVGTVRSIVDDVLFEKGYGKKLRKQKVIGIPTHDLNEIIFSKNLENSNIAASNPEAVNLAISEHIIKQYALDNVFSQDVSRAHLEGVYHIHDLGYIVRLYCSGHSLEFLKKYGLELENLQTSSKPATYARTLTGHLNTFLSVMQSYYAGALGIGFMNVLYAPYLENMSYAEIKQEIQYLVFSGSQNAFSRGGQSLFLDYNINLYVPDYLRETPAIGTKGKYTGKKYKDYEKEAQMFAEAFIEVAMEGDKTGKPFAFPKLDLHIDDKCFTDPEARRLLNLACEAASHNGSPYFVFDRDACTLSQCCRLKTKIEDMSILKTPEKIRFCGFQNVTINLPQASYRAKGKLEKTIEEIEWAMDLAMKAHLQKKKFIEGLMKPGLPLHQVAKVTKDGAPYINLENATYIIGILGLNECVQNITGKQLHESEEAFKIGLKIITHMYFKTKKLEKENKLKVTLEESPAESAAYRLAKCDLNQYPESKSLIKGNIDSGNQIYYTNSIHLAADAPVGILDRIVKQAKFHTLIESGAITHVFLGEQRPDPAGIFNLIEKTWRNTQTAQLTISPEFCVCEDCGHSWR